MVEFVHTYLPLKFSSEKEEHLCVRNDVGIFDVSHMGEFLISGPLALEFLNKLLTNNIYKLKANYAHYTLMLNNHGGIIDDIILYNFGNDRFMLCVNAANIINDWQWLKSHASSSTDLIIDNASQLFSQIAVQGPKSAAVLELLVRDTLPSRFGIKEMMLDKIACLIARTGYTGEDGFEIFLSNEAAAHIWDLLLDKGKPFGIKPCGLAARDSLRLEAGMRLHGVDMDENSTPLEADLLFAVDFNKNFIGKEALLRQKEEGLKKILSGFKVIDPGIARHGFKVFDSDKKAIGEVCSGTLPPTQKNAIGLAYLDPAWHKTGRDIYIDIRGRYAKAQTHKARFI
jgi:aminomethyltransferase